MCRRATCPNCGRVTWSGCGNHVDEVMRSVPADDRCTCTAEEREQARSPGFLARLFGR